MDKRILITSIPSWNRHTGSNTFSSLFDAFDEKDLANIYIQSGLPDSEVASRYFNISEREVIRSIFRRNSITGKEVQRLDKNGNIQVADKGSFSSISKLRWRIFLWMREIAWMLGKWNSKELDAFLADFKPEVLVFPIESYPHFNRINEYIIRRCKPDKVIGYLWDDNFTYKQHPYNVFHLIERYFLRKQVKRLVGKCSDVLAIGPKMKEECDKEFGINSVILTKPIGEMGTFIPYNVGIPIRILYTGKLIIGREKTVAKIVKAIQEVNANGTKIILDIYTNTVLDAKMRKAIEVPGCCNLHDPVPQSEVLRLQKEADVLLFVESLSNKDLTARLSFSTKLTDYFSAGKCIWAVGHKDLGPISYLEAEKAGLISHDKKSIKDILTTILNNPVTIPEYAQNAYNCGLKNHTRKEVIDKLKSLIGN